MVAGRVRDLEGRPCRAPSVDVWQASADGFYDVQQPDLQPERNLRGLFTADEEGRYWFRTVLPRSTRSPTTARSATCSPRPAGIRTGRRTST